MSKVSDVRVVLTSFVVSIFDVALNLLVALVTGSTVMLSQALQGLSDLITGGILFMGVKRSKRQSDNKFQFGYGREIFFWVLIAGIVMFGGTGLASVLLGYNQIVKPEEIENIWLAIAMLVVGFSTNFYAFRLSLVRLKQHSRSGSLWRHLISSSIVETKATFIIDFLGTLAAVIGFVSLVISLITGNEQFDGLGSIAIGLAMMVGAILLMKDVRDLIVGKSVDKDTSRRIIRAATSIDGVNKVLDLRTMYLGSEKLLVILEVHIQDDLDTDTIEKITDIIKTKVQRLVPIAQHIQIEIETPDNE
ncbi:MAG TPA: cation diffusion facilitator family transporter [Candidatus Nanoperiomorbaceae bacterium]|nr:MAG: cation diffusion facilitator family transporter [Candidatus Saccharibacteria bacterium]HMQ09581.1 cation diffusion facilitator family transporter [Candidatus Nanoperiomorbaceae bacterium]HMQ97333.1 cation diffusion facilitator family transporter [Candidatus Nanoperiomorbaceae bacterium]HMR86496.1 cation diffusion facilitator family transporter [Candidatus Nanoperiomorbaceae bacterium]HMU12350.1 cation diffusion facilitator family transporter [Candidatus Nanoperiomorbaceae bacterium]